MKQNYLLIADVEDIGRCGEVISVKAGFARNYLIPQELAVPANRHTLRMQARLQQERATQSAADKAEAEKIASELQGVTLTTTVKVDPEGNMYGSVGFGDVLALFAEQGFELERRNIGLNKPIKMIGVHPMVLHLKEDVLCDYTLHILGEQASR
ncbi:50S ribosomal protein L9 [Rhabdochlamydiaceae symbiont of Dictyostelium giganteum]|uniref:50S ribosomal protein L9 n=1 Tax=Rhabdochlamydiaceae symbiont of Dictyostelium giganteum TaxID=3342349 RepID=UPI0038501BDE